MWARFHLHILPSCSYAVHSRPQTGIGACQCVTRALQLRVTTERVFIECIGSMCLSLVRETVYLGAKWFANHETPNHTDERNARIMPTTSTMSSAFGRTRRRTSRRFIHVHDKACQTTFSVRSAEQVRQCSRTEHDGKESLSLPFSLSSFSITQIEIGLLTLRS